MRRRTAPIGWPRYDPRLHRFELPNIVWSLKLAPREFVVLACLHAQVREEKEITASVHMSNDAAREGLAKLKERGIVNESLEPTIQCGSKNYFTLPNEVLLLRLSPSVFAVYAFLLCCEDRRTHQCHPSLRTIAETTNISLNTASKSVSALVDEQLIAVEHTSYIDAQGRKWNGNNLYTILPISTAMEMYHARQKITLDRQRAAQETLRVRREQQSKVLTRPQTATQQSEAVSDV